MIKNVFDLFKGRFSNFALVCLFSFSSNNALAQTVNKTLGFFDGALLVQVTGPKVLSAGANKDNTFLAQVTDANGTPYPAITAKFVTASVEMTNMDMGVTSVKIIGDVLDVNKQYQGKISLNPSFSMKGPWKMNIKIIVADENGNPMSDTQALTFDVNK